MKTNSIKKLFMDATLAVALVTMVACSNKQSTENKTDTKDVAEESNDAKYSKAAEKDAQFVVDAVSHNYEIIKLGTLAQTNAFSAEVKSYGKMMADAHTKANTDLMALAATKGISTPQTPTNEALSEYDKMKDETGKDFDRKISSKMVNIHKDAIDKFEKASAECQDADIKNWATSMLPDLRTHLDQAIVNDKMASQQ